MPACLLSSPRFRQSGSSDGERGVSLLAERAGGQVGGGSGEAEFKGRILGGGGGGGGLVVRMLGGAGLGGAGEPHSPPSLDCG